MKSLFPSAAPLAVIFAMLTLIGCATSQEERHGQLHPQSESSQPSGTMSSGPSDGPMEKMDMKAMCDMHDKMMSGKTPQEQAAIMNDYMKNMSPEMVQKHMQMMQQQCKQ